MLISELAKQPGAGEGPCGSLRPTRAGCGGGGPGGQPEGSGRGRRARSAAGAEAEERQWSGLGHGPDGAVGWEMQRDSSGEAAGRSRGQAVAGAPPAVVERAGAAGGAGGRLC